MSYNVVLTRSFKHSVERLKKRFRHVKDDVRLAVEVLLQSPRLGVPIPGGSGIRKLRVLNSDLAKVGAIACSTMCGINRHHCPTCC
jgi:hypothetical protein